MAEGFPCWWSPSHPPLHSQPPAVSPAPRLSLTSFAISSLSLSPASALVLHRKSLDFTTQPFAVSQGRDDASPQPSEAFVGGKKVGFVPKIISYSILELGSELVI